jgi:hypothetical protein
MILYKLNFSFLVAMPELENRSNAMPSVNIYERIGCTMFVQFAEYWVPFCHWF